MDRSREARRASTAATNGLSKRRHRSSNLRDSAEEDAPMDLHEMVRVRDRGNGKKDRDRDRDRDWERERERDRERDRDRDRMNRSKRRRGDKYKNNREDGGDESSEESVNDEEDEDDDDREGLSVRVLAPNPVLPSSSIVSTHHHRKNFTPAKVFRATPPWKHADEMIGVPVPRKARSASTKRSHECWVSSGGTGGGGVVGDHIHQQASTSPVRPGLVVAASPAPAPNSPSSSNTSVRKKTKPSGQKLRPPPKSTSKSSSLNQEEIEIEIAEVLYGLMRQPQGSLKQETMATDLSKFDARENKSAGDAKSRVSSPVSNSPLVAPPSSSMLPHNPSSFITPTAIAPKRKRPRPVTYNENLGSSATRSSPILSTKTEIDRPAETDSASPHLQKGAVSVAENGTVSHDVLSANSTSLFPVQPENPETTDISDRKRLTEEPLDRKGTIAEADEVFSLKKESGDGKLTVGNKASSTSSAVETDREAKFEIDLMVPLPQLRSSPERAGANDHLQVPLPGSSNVDIGMRTSEKEDEKPAKLDPVNPEPEKNAKPLAEEVELLKLATKKETVLDLQLDLDKNDRDSGTAGAVGDMLHQQVTKQPQPQQNLRNDANIEKNVQSGPLPLPISLASWPGGLPPMGYISPLPGVVSMGGGGTVTPAAIQPPHLFSQPRPKRCATHCYIARNIHYHQQFTRMNHFWPAAAAAASTSSLYGAKPCHLNVVPPADLLGSVPGKSADTVPDKGQGLVMFPGHSSTERASQPSNIADAAVQRKQIMLQQALPAGAAPNNILHGPAFIFPLNQQQAAAAAAVSARAGSIKSSSGVGAAASSKASNPASVSSSASAAAPVVNFSYPNIPANETQYLAFLQNNGYPFPIPAHVGAPPAYRGAHAQAMPFFNGSFYSSQMLHPSSHLQQQQQVSSQTLQIQQGHQNTSLSGGSSSSQKNLQNSQQRQQSSGSLLNFPAPKSQPSQLLLQQQQRNQHASMPHQARQIENEVGGEDSPSTADSRVSRTNLNVYAQNYSMPFHPQNFALMTPAAFGGGNGNTHNDKKQAQHPQQGVKAGAEPLPSQAFAMSFANINAAAASASGFDIPSVAQNHAVLQNLPEAARHGYQLMAAAAAAAQAAQQKNFRILEDGKSGVGGESLSIEEERKKMVAKAPAPGQFIAFSRPDLIDSSACTLSGNTLADSPARTLNIGSASAAKAPNSVPTTTTGMANLSHSQRQQQQMIQLQKQHQFAVAAARNKAPATSNGCVYSEHLPSSSMAAKFPSSLSSLAPSLAQSSSNPPAGQSPQWKNSSRPTPSASQGLSPTVGSSASSSSLKNPLQQPGRTPQSHAQISFGGNAKSQMQHPSPSSPMAVGSHSPSSISKSGSPRASANTTVVNKHPQSSTLQQSKGPSSIPSRKSSPVPSILGNPHISTSSSSGAGPRPQMPQQQHHQLPKQAMQQAQMLFSNAAYSTNTAGGASAASSYYLQRRRHDQPLGTSSGMLSLCPPVDPAKAAAKGGLPSQGIFQAAQFAAQSTPGSGNPHHLVPAGFSYMHAIPAAVQAKQAEQKQPAGE